MDQTNRIFPLLSDDFETSEIPKTSNKALTFQIVFARRQDEVLWTAHWEMSVLRWLRRIRWHIRFQPKCSLAYHFHLCELKESKLVQDHKCIKTGANTIVRNKYKDTCKEIYNQRIRNNFFN